MSAASINFSEQQLFQVLCLLEVREAAAKHGIELVQSSLRKLTSKGLEVILFRLYAAINGESRAAKDFRNIWPTVDRNQVKEFDQRMSEWFKEVKERHQLETLSAMTANKLRSAQPARLIPCLLELATLALQAQYTKLAPQEAASFNMKVPAEKDPGLMHHVGHVVRDLASAAVQEQMQRFLDLTTQSAHLQTWLEAGANDLTDQFYATQAIHQQCTEMAANLQLAGNLLPVGGLCGMLAVSSSNTAHEQPEEQPSLQLLPGQMELPLEAAQQLPALSQLDAHLGHYPTLDRLLGHTVGSHVHPYAVDGSVLKELMTGGQAAARSSAVFSGFQGDAESPLDTLDIVEVVDDWVTGLEQLGGSLTGLVCPSDEVLMAGCSRMSVSSQSSFGLGHRSLTQVHGKTEGEALHPLLAPPSDSTGHAALLATQLRSHKATGVTLHSMVVQLRTRLLDAESQLQQVVPEVKQAMEGLQALQQPASHAAGGSSSLRSSHPRFTPASPRIPTTSTTTTGSAALQHPRLPAARRSSGAGLPSPSPRVKGSRLEWLLKRQTSDAAPPSPARGLASPMHGTTPRRTPKTNSRRASLAAFADRHSLPMQDLVPKLRLASQSGVPPGQEEQPVVQQDEAWGSAGGSEAPAPAHVSNLPPLDGGGGSSSGPASPDQHQSAMMSPPAAAGPHSPAHEAGASRGEVAMHSLGVVVSQSSHPGGDALSPSHPLYGLMSLDDDGDDDDDLLFHFKAR